MNDKNAFPVESVFFYPRVAAMSNPVYGRVHRHKLWPSFIRSLARSRQRQRRRGLRRETPVHLVHAQCDAM